MYCRVECSAADELKYVLGIYADLEYSIGNQNIILKVRDRNVALDEGDKKVAFGEHCTEMFEGYEDYTNATEKQIWILASTFFIPLLPIIPYRHTWRQIIMKTVWYMIERATNGRGI